MARLAAEAEHRYYFVLSKRLMIRVAEAIARREGYGFLVTGENLGQVSSQTLANLGAIDAAASLPILRPLLGFDKVEIVRRAEALGTFEISKGPEFCDVLGPARPATAVRSAVAAEQEERLDYPGLVASALGKVERLVLASSQGTSL
jgi:thiamine biosynthesis protein ThiI